MFGRHLELSVVKNDKDRMVETTPILDPEDINRVAKKVIKYLAVGTVATFAAVITMNTASEIAVNRLSIENKKED